MLVVYIFSPKNPAASWPLRGGHMSTLEASLFTAPVPTHVSLTFEQF